MIELSAKALENSCDSLDFTVLSCDELVVSQTEAAFMKRAEKPFPEVSSVKSFLGKLFNFQHTVHINVSSSSNLCLCVW